MTLGGGRFRHEVVFQRLDPAAATDGGHVDKSLDSNWQDFCTRRAEIYEESGREFRAGQQIRADITHTVKVRFDASTRQITSDMRIEWDDGGTVPRILNIESLHALGDGRRAEMVIRCKEVQ